MKHNEEGGDMFSFMSKLSPSEYDDIIADTMDQHTLRKREQTCKFIFYFFLLLFDTYTYYFIYFLPKSENLYFISISINICTTF